MSDGGNHLLLDGGGGGGDDGVGSTFSTGGGRILSVLR